MTSFDLWRFIFYNNLVTWSHVTTWSQLVTWNHRNHRLSHWSLKTGYFDAPKTLKTDDEQG